MADTIGRYRVTRRLKAGGMAEVLEAYSTGEGGFERRVALKRLLPECGEDPSFVRGFIDEAKIISQLHHASIVGVFDFGVAEGSPYLVLEFVDGLDLADLLARMTVLPDWVALHIATEIAYALGHAHQSVDAQGRPMGLVHRDVSPENVMLSWNGDVKLADFGVAFALRRLEATRVGIAKGKPLYMAPEQLRANDVDGRADLFSLGCVLHELLTGRSAIAGDELQPLGSVRLDAALPPDIKAIIERATRFERQERYKSAEQMAEALGTALAGRLTKDARSALRAWLALLAPAASAAPMSSQAGDGPPSFDRLREATAATEAPTAPGRDPTLSGSPTRSAPLIEQSVPGRDPMLGTSLHGYTLVAEIGRGAWGRVYHGEHALLGRACAVKVLAKAMADNPRSIERLRREGIALARLDHPNIVRLLDFGTTPDGSPFMAMELLRGKTLRQVLLEEGPLSLGRAAQLVRQIAEGLGAAHAQQVIHRDLKPGNVMLIGEPGREQVKILDFGIAHGPHSDLAPLTKTDEFLGTPAYMAPEQIRNPSSVEPLADVYSLGVMLYEMLTGRLPFTGALGAIVEAKLHQRAPTLPPSGGLERLAARMLEPEPSARLSSARAVLAELDAQGFGARPIAARADSATGTLESRRTFARGLALGLVPALVLVGNLIAAAISERPERPIAASAEVDPQRPVAIQKPSGSPPPAPPVEATEGPAPTGSAAPSPARPELAEPAEPAPKLHRVGRALPPKSTKDSNARSAAELDTAWARSLAARGLSPGELAVIVPLPAAMVELRSALAQHDAAAAAQLEPAARQALEALRLPPTVIKAKLARIATALESAVGKLEAPALEAFQRRYFELRAELRPGLPAARIDQLALELSALESELRSRSAE